MRIDDSDTFAFADVVDGHVGNESSFTGAGFTDDVGVAATVFAVFDAKDGIFVLEFGFSKEGNGVAGSFVEPFGNREVFGRVGIEFFTPGNVGEFGEDTGEMPKSGEFFGVEDLGLKAGFELAI